jgi:O-antigen/teichoic acid export membrane protein
MRAVLSGRLGDLLRGSLLVTATSAAINFGAGIALARLCGPNALGQFVLLVASAHLAFAILSPGFDQAYIQKPDAPGRWAAAVVLTAIQGMLLLTVPIGLLAAFSAAKLGWMPVVDIASFTWIMVGIVCSLAGNLLLAPLAVALAYRQVNGVRLVAAAVASAISVGWAYQQPEASFTPLVLREVCAGCLLLAGALVKTKLPPWTGRPAASALRDTLQFSRDLWALNVLEKCVQRVEYLALGLVTSTTNVGVYFAIRSIFDGIYGVVSVPIQTVLFAYLCRNARKDQLFACLNSTRVRRVLLPALAGVALVGALSTPLFALLLGARFTAHWTLTAAFATLVASLLLFELMKIAMMALGRHRALLPARGAQLLALMIAVPALGQWAGVSGAAVAAMLAAFMLLLTAALPARRLAGERQ